MKKERKNPKETKECLFQVQLKALIEDHDERYAVWYDAYENGTSDPNWTDGSNLNLVRTQIEIQKKRIKNLCDENGRELPEAYYREVPPTVDSNYMAKADQIFEHAQRVLEYLNNLASYKELLSLGDKLSEPQRKAVKYDSAVMFVTRLAGYIERNDLVGMRLYRNTEWYEELIVSSLEKAKKVIAESKEKQPQLIPKPEPKPEPKPKSKRKTKPQHKTQPQPQPKSTEWQQISLFDAVAC